MMGLGILLGLIFLSSFLVVGHDWTRRNQNIIWEKIGAARVRRNLQQDSAKRSKIQKEILTLEKQEKEYSEIWHRLKQVFIFMFICTGYFIGVDYGFSWKALFAVSMFGVGYWIAFDAGFNVMLGKKYNYIPESNNDYDRAALKYLTPNIYFYGRLTILGFLGYLVIF